MYIKIDCCGVLFDFLLYSGGIHFRYHHGDGTSPQSHVIRDWGWGCTRYAHVVKCNGTPSLIKEILKTSKLLGLLNLAKAKKGLGYDTQTK